MGRIKLFPHTSS